MQDACDLTAGTTSKKRINRLANMFCALCLLRSKLQGHQFSSSVTLDPKILPFTKYLNFFYLLFSSHNSTRDEKVNKSRASLEVFMILYWKCIYFYTKASKI